MIYKFTNNTGAAICIFDPKGKGYTVENQGNIVIELDNAAPVSTKLTFAKSKKVYSNFTEFILVSREINNLISGLPYYSYSVENPVLEEKVEEVVEQVIEETDETVKGEPVVFEIEEYSPVMYVGDTQKIKVKASGVAGGRTSLTSSDSKSAKARGLAITAVKAGDVQITVKYGDLTKTLLLEVRDRKVEEA